MSKNANLIHPAIKLFEILNQADNNANLKPEDHSNLEKLLTKAIFIFKKVEWSVNFVDESEPMEVN